MAYIAPIHRPSSVRHALSLSFLAPNSDDLIVAKANRLEIYSPSDTQPDQLVLQHVRSIYGKITLLQKLRPARSETDHVFIGTDRYHYFTLGWDAERKELVTWKKYHDIAEKSARDSQTGDRVSIDPSARFLTLECYEGVVNVLPITHAGKGKRKVADNEIGELGDPIPVRIPELFVKSSCFLHKRESVQRQVKINPEIALLWEDSATSTLRVTIRELEFSPSLRPHEELGSAELDNAKEVDGEVELGSSHLIPLPAPMYGMLIIGETSVSYVEEWNYKVTETKPLDKPTVWAAWCKIDDQRYVLADDYGRMFLLFVQQNSEGEYQGHQIDLLGETSRANTLVYLDGGRIFVGSHQSDSQIIQISEKSLEVVQTFNNLAPILDFTVMDMGNRSSDAPVNEFSSGQARIVTGSGAFKDGSLRSVRSGVGLEDLGSIGEMGAPVVNVFSLKSSAGVDTEDTLIVSFVAHTRAFVFDADGGVEEVDSFRGFELGEATLYAGGLKDGRAVQVAGFSVLLSDSDSGMVTGTWRPPDGSSITAVSAEGDTVLISLGGAALVVLDVSGQEVKEQAQRQFGSSEQVSCTTLSQSTPGCCIAGFWEDSKVAVLSLSDLQPIAIERVAEDQSLAVPRSLVVANLLPSQPPTLFIGLADGNVVTYTVASPQTPFTARKSVILGTQQTNFALLPRNDGLQNVFATCEHPSLIYGSEGGLVYSAVTAEGTSSICSFNSAAYPNAIALATEEGELKLALVDEERTTHVQTLQVGETVRRVAYSPDLKAFGLGAIKRLLQAGEETIESRFRLVDEVAFQELHVYDLNQDELVESVMRCKIDGEERFVVGTSYLDDEESGGTARGRILVLEVTQERKLKVVAEMVTRGACRCLGALEDGSIVAGLVKTVVVYNLQGTVLSKLAAYRTATAPIDLTVTGNIIAITDLMKSLTLVTYTAGTAPVLSEIARHFETAWGSALAQIDDTSYLQADCEGNLMVLQHDVTGFADEDRRRLKVTSELLLGETVNRMRRVDVQPSPNAVVVPRAFLATVEGGVYLFALIAAERQDLLMRLQAALAERIVSPGGVPFALYRGFYSGVRSSGDEGPMRFVDGELVERFLDLGEEAQEAAVKELPGKMGLEEVRELVEGLRRVR